MDNGQRKLFHMDTVPTAQGKQGKWQIKENTGNLGILFALSCKLPDTIR